MQTFLLRRQQAWLCAGAERVSFHQETNKETNKTLVQFILFNDVFRFLKSESAAPVAAETAVAATGAPNRTQHRIHFQQRRLLSPRSPQPLRQRRSQLLRLLLPPSPSSSTILEPNQ